MTKKQEKKPEEKLDFKLPQGIPKEAEQKLKQLKTKIDKFQKEILKKFDKYIMGITLLPPQKPKEGEPQKPKDAVNLLILVDDSDSKKMPKYELKEKLGTIIAQTAKDIDKNIVPQTIILSELWQNCYDAKYDLLEAIAQSAIVFDKGMLAAVKISEVHKQMVLKKFEKYIVSYVLAGSLVQGKATPESDIDVFVVIDDTDVKKMTRAELKDKLRAIIIGMGLEAAEITGIKNKINIQVYILTDFWDNIKEANPIIFTFLRDGIPFYDRGIFMPWKQLLRMGKVKPSPEAIDIFMSSGEQMLKRVQFRINEIGMEDIFYAILTPSQAALMLYGVPPPTPKETPDMLREVFVKKEKMLEDKWVKVLEKTIEVRKELERQSKKNITGTELDNLLKDANDYLKRINKLFSEIDKIKEEESVLHTYESAVTVIRDILNLEGTDHVPEDQVIPLFEKNIVAKGYLPQKYHRVLKVISKAKKDYDEGKLTKTEVNQVKKESRAFMKTMIEYIQRKRGKELEKTKIRVKHGKKFGEVILLGKEAFIIHDVDNPDREISKAEIAGDGSLKNIKKATPEEFEKAIVKVTIPPKVFIKQPIFNDLKEIFGKDVEVSLNY
ncbi:nucleotidyltransferase domain-containing protein [Candidatus Woesearchaeota archaeon]|nr:nucleotidyltransferase domain-containing protein [Candidatus Woesearchaeota archaeon]